MNVLVAIKEMLMSVLHFFGLGLTEHAPKPNDTKIENPSMILASLIKQRLMFLDWRDAVTNPTSYNWVWKDKSKNIVLDIDIYPNNYSATPDRITLSIKVNGKTIEFTEQELEKVVSGVQYAVNRAKENDKLDLESKRQMASLDAIETIMGVGEKK